MSDAVEELDAQLAEQLEGEGIGEQERVTAASPGSSWRIPLGG